MPYIVIDGMDGSGKGSVVEAVYAAHPDFVFVREPGGTELGEKIREVILGNDMLPLTEMFLFAAQRAEVKELVSGCLREGKTVFSDRADSSTFAYQVVAHQRLDLEGLFWETRKILTPHPDAYIFLDLEPSIAVERTGKRSSDNRLDTAGVKFFARVRSGFQYFAETVGLSCHIIDATPGKEVVAKAVLDVVKKVLSEKAQ